MSVLVEGNKIVRIATSIDVPAGATVIDAKGRTLTPGLIDAHYGGAKVLQVAPEIIHRRGPWRSFEAVEFATL